MAIVLMKDSDKYFDAAFDVVIEREHLPPVHRCFHMYLHATVYSGLSMSCSA